MRFKIGDTVYLSADGNDGNFSGPGQIVRHIGTPGWADGEWYEVKGAWGTMGFPERRISPATCTPESVFDWGERRRFRDEATGYEKDTSAYRFDLIPADALAELAKVYGIGEEKYPSGPGGPNWMQGGPFWPSRAALSRHLASYDLGEDIDPSDGTYHLAKVAWHAFALLVYGPLRNTGTDTRGSLKKKEVS